MAPSARSPIRTYPVSSSRFSGRDSRSLHRRRSRDRSPSRERRPRYTTPSRRRYNDRFSRSPARRSVSPPRYRVRRASPVDVVKQPSDPSRKVFVTNLSRNIESRHLREIFGTFGELICADVSKYDDFQVSNSFGHVIYKDLESSQQAMKHMQGGQIDGLTVSLEYVAYNRQPSSERRECSTSSKE